MFSRICDFTYAYIRHLGVQTHAKVGPKGVFWSSWKMLQRTWQTWPENMEKPEGLFSYLGKKWEVRCLTEFIASYKSDIQPEVQVPPYSNPRSKLYTFELKLHAWPLDQWNFRKNDAFIKWRRYNLFSMNYHLWATFCTAGLCKLCKFLIVDKFMEL